MSWYYVEEGAQKGPVDDKKFEALVEAGAIRSDTLVWREGMADWKPWAQAVPAPGAPAGAAAAVGAPAGGGAAVAVAVAPDGGVCAECGGTFSRNDMVAYGDKLVCAGCRDAFFQKVREGVETGGAFNYGGFWIRFLAKFIDSLLLMAVNFMIQIPYMMILMPMTQRMEQNGALAAGFVLLNLLLIIIQMGIMIGYTVFFLGRFGATPGKMALSLKVVRSDGGKVTYGRALGRAFAELLSGMILYIGYIMAAFDEEKRTLHDRICDTRVIRAN